MWKVEIIKKSLWLISATCYRKYANKFLESGNIVFLLSIKYFREI